MKFGRPSSDDQLIDGTKPKSNEYVDFIYRKQWGSDPEKAPDTLLPLPVPVESIVMTWTETPRCYTVDECSAMIRMVQKRDIANGMPDIRYHFMVGMDGKVYEGRGPRWQGITYADTAVDSKLISGNSVEIAFIDQSGTKPHWDQYKGLSAVVNLGLEMKWLLPVFKFYISKGAFITYFKPFDSMKNAMTTGYE